MEYIHSFRRETSLTIKAPIADVISRNTDLTHVIQAQLQRVILRGWDWLLVFFISLFCFTACSVFSDPCETFKVASFYRGGSKN